MPSSRILDDSEGGGGGNPEYVNTSRIEDHSWFVGEMDREGANVTLMRYPPGTYLVRKRVNADNGEFAGYALSLRTEGDVKHMKVCTAMAGLVTNSVLL